jgi:hypothetical protein
MNISLNKPFFVISIIYLLFNNYVMGNDTSLYKVIKTKDCIEYIERFGLTINDDNPDISIKSQSGLIYTLQNGEVVLIPSNFDLNYPGIIFRNKSVFNNCVEQDYFPIDYYSMSWLERNYDMMKNFEKSHDFFYNIISNSFLIVMPFREIKDLRNIFLEIQSKIVNSKTSTERVELENFIYAYALSLICYLKEYKSYQLIMLTEYENYNPYLYPIMLNNNRRLDVLSKVSIYINSSSSNSFESLLLSLGIN